MADNVVITPGTGNTIGADEVTDADLGSIKVQYVKLMDGTLDGTDKALIDASGLKVNLGADNDVTVTGTVDLGATDNAVLDAIESDTTAILSDTTTIASDTTSIDSKIPALGQALAAASVPVVLTAAQVSTLTPPAAITGYATSAKQDDIIAAIEAIPGGGGTQYTEGDTDATITGTAAMVEGAANALAVMTQPLTDTQLRAADVKITLDGESVPVTNAGITTIAGAVSGTEMQVDVLTMPTTTVTATDLDIRPLVNTDVVTAELSAVDNAVLDTIAAKDFATQTTLAAINAKLVTGTVIGDVNLGATDNAVLDTIATHTGNAATSLGTLDNAISGSEMQVDVVAALPAGTNTIGAVKSVPSDIDINGSNANHADKYYTNAGAVTDGIIWSPAAGKRWHILTLYINVSAAATVTLEDDLAGGDVVRWKGELAANSGVILKYDKEHPFSSGEDAADLLITTTAGNVYVQAVGYEV